jgi:hypothetical protein
VCRYVAILILVNISGPAAIADAIKNMGALTSLNLSSNDLQVEGAKIVAKAIKVTNRAIAVVFVLFHPHLTTRSTAVVYCYP